MLKENEYFYVKSYYCETVEDDYEKGEVGENCSYWDGKDFPSRDMKFKSIKDALEQILREQCYDESNKWLDFFADSGDESDRGYFDCDVTVNENNSEAYDGEIAAWKKGELKLYNCHIVAHIGIRSERELSDEELQEYALSPA